MSSGPGTINTLLRKSAAAPILYAVLHTRTYVALHLFFSSQNIAAQQNHRDACFALTAWYLVGSPGVLRMKSHRSVWGLGEFIVNISENMSLMLR